MKQPTMAGMMIPSRRPILSPTKPQNPNTTALCRTFGSATSPGLSFRSFCSHGTWRYRVLPHHGAHQPGVWSAAYSGGRHGYVYALVAGEGEARRGEGPGLRLI